METTSTVPPTFTIKLFGDGYVDADWAEWMADTYRFAQHSPDPSTQNAAMLFNPDGAIISYDCNRFPSGVEYTPERWERPLKYEIIEHAERNAIYHAASVGARTRNSTMVAPWAACADCARAIIQSGVKRLVRHKQSTERGQGRAWDGTISTADVMLREAGIEIIDLDWMFGNTDLTIRHSGQVFTP